MQLAVIYVALALCGLNRNPRTKRDPAYIRSLADNIAAVGQKVPALGFWCNGVFEVIEGGCRLEALKLAGKPELMAMDLGKEPTNDDLLMAAASVDAHHNSLPPMDRARLYETLVTTRKVPARQIAKELGVNEAVFSRTRDLNALCPDLHEPVNSGKLEYSKAILIAREPDHAKQLVLAGMAATMTSAQLRGEVKEKPADAPKAAKIKLELPGCTVVITGSALSLDDAINALASATREIRAGKEAGYTARTISRMAADKAKKGKP